MTYCSGTFYHMMYRRHVMFRAVGPYVAAPCIIGESKTRPAMPVLAIYSLDQRGKFIFCFLSSSPHLSPATTAVYLAPTCRLATLN
jgi:hypothetical protein